MDATTSVAAEYDSAVVSFGDFGEDTNELRQSNAITKITVRINWSRMKLLGFVDLASVMAGTPWQGQGRSRITLLFPQPRWCSFDGGKRVGGWKRIGVCPGQ